MPKPKRKGGIPLDELLAAHGSGRVIETTPKRRTPPKTAQKGPKNALGRVLPPAAEQKAIEPASPRLVGYARVSTDDQTTALQLDALKSAGCAVIHEDSASGAARSRPGLDRAIAELAAGDTLVVWRLDRLGRSLRDLLELADVLRGRGVALRSLTDHIDTGTAAGQMLYAVLGAVAQFERDVLRERTVAGMRAARTRGEHIGRPFALTPAQVREAKTMLTRGESPNHVARVLRVGRSTLYRAIATA